MEQIKRFLGEEARLQSMSLSDRLQIAQEQEGRALLHPWHHLMFEALVEQLPDDGGAGAGDAGLVALTCLAALNEYVGETHPAVARLLEVLAAALEGSDPDMARAQRKRAEVVRRLCQGIPRLALRTRP